MTLGGEKGKLFLFVIQPVAYVNLEALFELDADYICSKSVYLVKKRSCLIASQIFYLLIKNILSMLDSIEATLACNVRAQSTEPRLDALNHQELLVST